MTKAQTKKAYLDYVNNFITVSAFAAHYEMTTEQALKVITEGRELQNNQ